MNFFQWTSEMELGIPVIDEQHKRIVDYINDLHHAIEENNKQKVLIVAENVISYTHDHFNYEETLLKKAGYVLTEPHIAVHNRFKESAEQMKQDVVNGDSIEAAKKMRSSLTIWITNHIKKEDADYAESVGHLFRKKSFLSGMFNFFSKK